MRPEEYQPKLTWWSHTWRLAVMLSITALAWGPRVAYQWQHARWWFALDLTLGVLTYLAVWWRRSHPVAVATFGNLAAAVSASSAGAGTLAMVSLSTRRRWREIIPQTAIALATGLVAEAFFSTPGEDSLLVRSVSIVIIVATMVGWGMYIGSRRELFAGWRARVILAESEQAAEIDRARAVERANIAREMHDVLAHRISTITMYAGALSYRRDLSSGEVRETAAVIEDTARLALTELREVLGLLREDPGDAEPERPQELTAGDFDALVAENRKAGMRIDYTRGAEFSGLASTRRRTLYRCLQEALTNARKHAPDTVVTVRLMGDEHAGVDLLVSNPLPLRAVASPSPGSRLGLVGVAERVELSGGRHSATSTDDQRFVLHVWLPWQS